MRPSVFSFILLLAALLPGIALAAGPAWSGQGGAPVAISADGGTVLSDGDIFTLYDAAGTRVWRGYGGSYAQAQGETRSPLALTADGKYSILGAGQGILYVDRSQKVFWQDSEYHPIDDLSLSPDENYVASVAQGRVSVYTRGGDLVWRNETYRDVKYVGISRNGLLTVAAGTGNVVHAYNQTGFELWNYTATGIRGVQVSPADSNIIVSSDYTLVCLHPSGNLLWKFYTGNDIRDFAISPDGSSVAAGNQGGRLVLVDRNGKQVFASELGNWVNAVSLNRDGSRVAAGNSDRKVYLFDRSGQLLFSDLTGSIVKGVALSDDGSALAASSDMVYYYDLKAAPTAAPTTAPPAPAATTAPPATATTRVTVPVTTPPAPPAPEETPPEETPSPESGSASLAVLAIGLGAAWAIARR